MPQLRIDRREQSGRVGRAPWFLLSPGFCTPASLVALAAMVFGSLAILFAMRSAGLYGDEFTYTQGAAFIAQFLTGGDGDGGSGDLAVTIYGTGWFMPGMYALGVPLYLLQPEPALWQIKVWTIAVNALLFAVLLWRLAPIVGRCGVLLFLVFPGLAPLWHVGAQSFLPDLPAGLLVAIALTIAFRVGQKIVGGGVASWKSVLALAGCLSVALYLRGPVLVTALSVNAALIGLALSVEGERKRNLARTMSSLAVFLALLAPWSLASSRHFDFPVVTTTNVPLVLADSFGSEDKTCFGPCPQGRDIWPAWRFSREVAASRGENPIAVQRDMMKASLEGVTLGSYLAQVREHFATFLLDPSQQLRVRLGRLYSLPEQVRPVFYWTVTGLTWVLYLPFMATLIAVLVIPFRRSDSLRVEAILLKVTIASMFLQPFFHKTSGRYWIALAPLAAWCMSLILRHYLQARTPAVISAKAASGWIDSAQVVFGAAIMLTGVAILIA